MDGGFDEDYAETYDQSLGSAMNHLHDELATYVGVLSVSSAHTKRAEDRAAYMHHLAAAALMFFLLHNGMQRSALAKWLADERQAFGRSFLSDNEGEKAEAAFERFAAAVEEVMATR